MIKTLRCAAFIGVIISALVEPASAGCRLLSCGFIVAGNSALPVIGMHDMRGKRTTVEAAPAYWTLRSDTGGQKADLHAHGYSGSVAVKYEFSSRWGIGLIGSVAKQSGESTINVPTKDILLTAEAANAGTPGGAGFGGGKVSNVGGSFIALVGTYDFFPNPDGFRFPVSVGVARVRNTLDFSHEFTNPNNGAAQQESLHLDQSGMGVIANVSFDFLTWDKKLRVMPGFYLAHGLSVFSDVSYRVRQNNGAVQTFGANSTGTPGTAAHDESATNDAPALYLSANYLPWDLGFTWNFTGTVLGGLIASNSIYSIHWQHRFGGTAQ